MAFRSIVSAPAANPLLRDLGGTVPGTLRLWVGMLVLLGACLVPGHHAPWAAFRQEAAAITGLFILCTASLTREARPPRWTLLALVLACVACVPLLQKAFGMIRYLDDAILASLYLSLAAAAAVAGVTLAASRLRDQLVLAWCCCTLLAGVVSTGMALSQWLGPGVLESLIDPMPPRDRPVGNLGQANQLATLLVLALIALTLLRERGQILGFAAALVAAWLVWGIALTQSRTAWLALALMTVGWFGTRHALRLKLNAATVAALWGLLIGALLTQPVLSGWIDGVAASAEQQVRFTSGTRPHHWATLWDALVASPWRGYGWSQIGAAQWVAAVNHPATAEWLAHSHNLILDLMLYQGVALGVLPCIALAAWLLARARAIRTAESFWLLAAVSVVLLHAMLEHPLHYAFFLIPTVLLMGVLDADAASPARAWASPRSSWVLLLAGMVTVSAWVGHDYLRAEEALRDMRLATLRVGQAPRNLPSPDWVLLQTWSEYYELQRLPLSDHMPAEQLDALASFVRRYPYPNMLARYMEAAARNGDTDSALHALRHACKVHTISVCDALRFEWTKLAQTHPAIGQIAFPVPRP